MKKILLTLMLIVLSTSVMAEWVGVGTNDDYSIYADSTTIRKSSNIVKMWNLTDFNTAQESISYMSATTQREYDCIEERARKLHINFYAKNMGNGDVIWINDKTSNWAPVAPGTVAESLWKVACRK